MTVIDEVIDVAVEGAGYFARPEATEPPQEFQCTYNVKGYMDAVVKENEKAGIRESLGKLTLNEYVTTPLQNDKKWMWIKLGATLATATTVSVAACAFLSSIPAAFITVVSVAAAVSIIAIVHWGSHLYSCYQRYDLDDLEVRDTLRKDIIEWNLEKVGNTFSFDQLLSYDLFKDVTKFSNEEAFYGKVRHLLQEKENLDGQRDRFHADITGTYNVGTSALKSWIRDCRVRSAALKSNQARNHPRRSEDLRNQGMSIGNVVSSGLRLAQEIDFAKLISPWDTWVASAKETANLGYTNEMDRLNSAFIETKAGN